MRTPIYFLLTVVVLLGFTIKAHGQISYAMIEGPTTISPNQQATYNVSFYNSDGVKLATPSITGYTWTSGGAVEISKTATSITVSQSYVGMINLWYDCEVDHRDNFTTSLDVYVESDVPSNPSTGFSVTNNCGSSLVSRTSNPSSGISWYWQTSASGTSTSLGSSSSITVSSASLYLRAYKASTGRWSASSVAVSGIAIYTAPQITQQPVSTSVAIGRSATFTVAANGTSLTYQWRKNGGTISGATSSTLTINGISASDAGSYDVVIKGAGGCQVISSAATLTDISSIRIDGRTAIKTGEQVTYNIVFLNSQGIAITTPAITGYTWTYGGATEISKTATSITVSQSYEGYINLWYECNAGGNDLSASLDVYVESDIPSNPSTGFNVTNNCGSSLVTRTSNPPSGIEWYWQTSASGTSTSFGSSSSITVSSSSLYLRAYKSATGKWSTGSLAVSGIAIYTAPQITKQPVSASVSIGRSATFTVAANGTSLTYQWRKNGGTISGATSSTLTINGVSASDAGSYDVVIRGAGGCQVVSNAATLTDIASIRIDGRTSIRTGEQVTYNVVFLNSQGVAITTPAITGYTWTSGGATEIIKTSTSITVSQNYEGYINLWYECNAGGNDFSTSLDVFAESDIPANPSTTFSLTNNCGSSMVTRTSNPPSGVEWYWQASASGTSASLGNTSSVTVSSASLYLRAYKTATAKWSTGSLTVSGITIYTAPQITQQPVNVIVAIGRTAVFSVTAIGTTLTYQWRKNGAAIPGATLSTLTINGVSSSDAGSYDVVIKGAGGCQVTSSAATLTDISNVKIEGPTAIKTGQEITYNISFYNSNGVKIATPAITGYTWTFGGATEIIRTATSITVSQSYEGYMNLWYECNAGGNDFSASLDVFVESDIPANPSSTFTITNGCGSAAVTRISNPPSGVEWYWQTSASGTSTSLGVASSITVSSATLYLRAYKTSTGKWSTGALAVSGIIIYTAPKITQQPVGVAVAINTKAELTVGATGTSLTYQWRKNGVAVTGATSSTFTINSLSVSDIGNYDVVIKGGGGCQVISSQVMLTDISYVKIDGPTKIRTGEQMTYNIKFYNSQNIEITTPPIVGYTWTYGGATEIIKTATSITVSQNYEGYMNLWYECNAGGNDFMASLEVSVESDIPSKPSTTFNVTNNCGSSIVTRTSNPFSGAQWYWQTSATGTSTSLGNLNSITVSSDNLYLRAYRASTGQWSVSSLAVTGIIIYAAPQITEQPVSVTAAIGANAVFSVTVDGINPTYQWRKNGAVITGANSSTFTINNLIASNAGNYDVVINGAGGCQVTSAVANLGFLIHADLFFNSDENYILSYTLQKEVKDESSFQYESIVNLSPAIQFYDGLGRPKQNISIGSSPSGKDIVQPVIYDEYGRERYQLLPYVLSDESNKGQIQPAPSKPGTSGYNTSDQKLFYNNSANANNGIVQDADPYSESLFESSPLNRVLERAAPGTVWRPTDLSGSSDGHTTKMEYTSNTTNDVLLMTMADNSLAFASSGGDSYANKYYYKTGELLKSITKEENYTSTSGNLNTVEEFKDKTGKVILKRSYVTNAQQQVEPLETYYVYDDLGLLRYVIPPKATQQLSLPLTSGSDLVKQLCYYYEYDYRNRMTMKQLPGASPVYMVYDNRDRLVLTQDGEQRKTRQWLFTKYDVLNRPVVTGVMTYASIKTQAEMQTIVDNAYTGTNARSYSVSRDNTTETGYKTSESFPIASDGTLTYLTTTYYDDYSYASPGSTPYPFTSELGSTSYNQSVKSLVTGSKVKILGTTNWLTSTNYYDDKYRVIQTTRQNNVGGADRVTNQYDFPGKIKQSLYTHTGTRSTTIAKRFEYDHAGRLLQIFHKIDANAEVLMSYMQYNELGQLINKKLHSSDASYLSYLQSIDYQYNIRGWLKKINSPTTVGLTHADEDIKEGKAKVKPDAFGMEIRYNDPFQ